MIKRNKGKGAMINPFKLGQRSEPSPSSSSPSASPAAAPGDERLRPKSPAGGAASSAAPTAAPRIDLLEEPSAPARDSRKSIDSALLTLQLTKTSFLQTRIDDAAAGRPLYVISSRGRDTQIIRLNEQRPVKVAHIHWPKHIPLEGPSRIRVQVGNGRWREAEEFLKYGSLFTSRKFTIPHYPHSLKWKRSGGAYNCTTTGVKGNVAVLDPSSLSAPPRIRVFHSLVEPDPTRPSLDYANVPILLLDHLVTTALLVASSADEWKTASSAPTGSSHRSTKRTSRPEDSSTPADHWMHLVDGTVRSAPTPSSSSSTRRAPSPTASVGGESAHPSSSGASEVPTSPASSRLVATNLIRGSRASIDGVSTPDLTPRTAGAPPSTSPHDLVVDTQNVSPGHYYPRSHAQRQDSVSSEMLSVASSQWTQSSNPGASPLDTPPSAASSFPPPSAGAFTPQSAWDMGQLAAGPAPLPAKLASELTRAHTYVAVAPQIQNQADSDSDSDGMEGGGEGERRGTAMTGLELQSLTDGMQRATFFPTLPAHRQPPPPLPGNHENSYDAPPSYDSVFDCAVAPPSVNVPAPVLASGRRLHHAQRQAPSPPRPATASAALVTPTASRFSPVSAIASTAPLRPRPGESRQLPRTPRRSLNDADTTPLKPPSMDGLPRNEAPLPPLPPEALSGHSEP